MRYLQSYRFIFQSSKWGLNLLLTTVCLLIPAIGQIVLIGYFFEMIDVLLLGRGRSWSQATDATGEQIMDALPARQDLLTEAYPDFNFNRFVDYLTRGIWPFLVNFIVQMVVGMLAAMILMAGFVIAGIASGSVNSPWPIFVAYAVWGLAYVVIQTVVGILTTPLYLRAGLSGDFVSAFSMEFFRDFMKRVGKEVVLVQLFVVATGTPLIMAGALLCFVGMYPAIMLMFYAHHHLEYQLYDLYLERGGTPVERKPQRSPSRASEVDVDRSLHVMPPPYDERSTDVMPAEDEYP